MHKTLNHLSLICLAFLPLSSHPMDYFSKMNLAIFNATGTNIQADILNKGEARKRNFLAPNKLFYLISQNQQDVNITENTILNIYLNGDTHKYDAQWEFPANRLIYIIIKQENGTFIVDPVTIKDKKINKRIVKKNEIKVIKS